MQIIHDDLFMIFNLLGKLWKWRNVEVYDNFINANKPLINLELIAIYSVISIGSYF